MTDGSVMQGAFGRGHGLDGPGSGALVVRPTTRSFLTSPARSAVVLFVVLAAVVPPLALHGDVAAWATAAASLLLGGGIVLTGELQTAHTLLRVEGRQLLYRGVWRERVVANAGQGDRLLEVAMQRTSGPQWRRVCLVQDANGQSHLTLYAYAWQRADLQAIADALGVPLAQGETVRDVWAMGRRYPGSVPRWMLRARRVVLVATAVVLAFFALATVAALAGA